MSSDSEVKRSTSLEDRLYKASLDLIEDFERKEVLQLVSARLDGLTDRYYGMQHQAAFIDYLVAQVKRQQPTSVIRLGDGEGNVLFAGDTTLRDGFLAKHAFQMIWILMFGRHPLSETDKTLFTTEFSESIRAADLIGMPVADQVRQKIATMTGPGKDVRGLVGVLGDWYWLAENQHIFDAPERRFGIWHYHIRLGDHLQAILSASGKVSAVTCYSDFLDLMSRRYDFRPGMVITIPPQAVNINDTPADVHYPDRYREIVDELDQDLTGHTFLVGAGLLGKMYCARIKKSGGIAIDIGSLIDVLIGHSVRPWHSPEIIERFSIKTD